MKPNPFLQPPGGILLSISTCAAIAEHLAGRLQAPSPASTASSINGISGISVEGLPDDPAVLLKAEQVAGILTVPKSTIYELSRRQLDPLPSRMIGRSKRFERAAVEAWIERQGSRR